MRAEDMQRCADCGNLCPRTKNMCPTCYPPCTRVTFGVEPDAEPLLLQPDLYGGPGQTVGEQGYLFDVGRAERKPSREQPRADQPEMFQ